MIKRSFFVKLLVFIVLFFLVDLFISLFLISGLNKYYGFDQNPNVLFNGSSMFMAGFDRAEIAKQTGFNISNYSHEGVSLKDRKVMIQQSLDKYSNDLDLVVFELNPVLFSNVETALNVYTSFYPFMDDQSIDEYIKSSASTKDYYLHKVVRCTRFDSRLLINIMKGYLGKFNNVKTATLSTFQIEDLKGRAGEVAIEMSDANIKLFEETIDFILSKGSPVLLVNMPVYQHKLATFDSISYQKYSDYIDHFCVSKSNVSYLNLNLDSMTKSPEYFSDPLHINRNGQNKLNDIISKEIGLLKNNFK